MKPTKAEITALTEEARSDAYGIVEIESGQEYEVHASPYYVRDKVALTTAERMARGGAK